MLLGIFIFSEVFVSDIRVQHIFGHGYDVSIFQTNGKTYKNWTIPVSDTYPYPTLVPESETLVSESERFNPPGVLENRLYIIFLGNLAAYYSGSEVSQLFGWKVCLHLNHIFILRNKLSLFNAWISTRMEFPVWLDYIHPGWMKFPARLDDVHFLTNQKFYIYNLSIYLKTRM